MNAIDKAWHDMLAKQTQERAVLATAQADQRLAFYREHKTFLDTRPLFDPERDYWRKP